MGKELGVIEEEVLLCMGVKVILELLELGDVGGQVFGRGGGVEGARFLVVDKIFEVDHKFDFS